MKRHESLCRFVAIVVVLAVAQGLSACARQTSDLAAGANDALIREIIDLINARSLDEAFERYALDYVYHGPGGQELRGREEIRAVWAVFLTGFPDLSARVDDVISQSDKIAMRWTLTGTHTGEFLDVAPTGNRMTLNVTEVFRVADGQLVEAWDQYDRLHLMQQIGELTND